MENNSIPDRQDFFFWSVILYVFFEIVRAADVYSFLTTIHAQRISMLIVLISALMSGNRGYIGGAFNRWLFLFIAALLIATIFAYDSSVSWDVTIIYLKLILFIFLTGYCINTEFLLKSFVLCLFLLVVLYIVLSIREYLLGQHVYDMGVRRIIGWDGQTGPNRLAIISACNLPFGIMMLKKESFVELRFNNILLVHNKLFIIIVWLYFPAAIVVILLTNSRTGLLLLLTFCMLFFLKSKKKLKISIVLLLVAIISYNAIPESSKHRYRSILVMAGLADKPETITRVDEISRSSAEGRLFGFKRGIEIFLQNPVMGVGPGGFQLISGNRIQAHNLIGQLFSETGLVGIITFFGLVLSILKNLTIIRRHLTAGYIFNLGVAMKDALFILVVGSVFAHTLFFIWWVLWGTLSLKGVLFMEEESPGTQNA